MLSLHNHTTTRAMHADWRDRRWQRALERALRHRASVRWCGDEGASALLVQCAGGCQAGGWHRVEWTADGLTCDCPSRCPCHHRARAWCEYMGEWDRLAAIAREHGIEAAVRLLVYDQTGELDVTPIRPLRDVCLWRACGEARADVPHVVRHSPTGIEWGYGGSGPADLARSILLHFYGPAVADALYQQFKSDVIARIPRDVSTYVLSGDAIASWVENAVSEGG